MKKFVGSVMITLNEQRNYLTSYMRNSVLYDAKSILYVAYDEKSILYVAYDEKSILYVAYDEGRVMDKDKVYWIWQDGPQYQLSWCDYTQQWSMIRNDSGRAF